MRNITESIDVMLQELSIECIEQSYTYKVTDPPFYFGFSFANETFVYTQQLTPIFTAAMVDVQG